MSISSIFVERPVATVLLAAGVALSGIVAFRLLPVAPLPQVDFPTIQVSATLPGADPETMASSVAAPLERHFGRIAALTEMTSSSTLGTTLLVLQFDLAKNIDAAAREVQAAINAAGGQLPPNLPQKPTYRKVNPSSAPVLVVALTSPSLSQEQIYDAASTVMQQKISQIEGVGQVLVAGSSLPAVRVEVNPEKLASYRLGLEDVRLRLAATNVNRPTGHLDDGEARWSLATNDQIDKAADYAPLILTYRNQSPVRLSDVAIVSDSLENVHTTGLLDSKPCVVLAVMTAPGTNVIETVDRVKKALPALQASISPLIHATVAIDRTVTIRASIHDVEQSLVMSVVLVTLVVLLFLRSPRATLIAGITVPLSLLGTFGVMYLCGYSLDNLSLMALTISTGFVVDDAVVVIDNISRHLEDGLSPIEASLRGARQIGFTVIAITVSLVAVFIPILLMGGIMGRLFHEFAVVLAVAITISMAVSLTATPMLCSRLLRVRSSEQSGWISRKTEQAFAFILYLYGQTLKVVLRHPLAALVATIGAVIVSGVMFVRTPKGFFPQQDTGMLLARLEMRTDSSFRAVRSRLSEVMRILNADPAVAHAVAITGGPGSTGTLNTVTLYISLKPQEERAPIDDVIGRLRMTTARVPGVRPYYQPVQDLRVGGRIANALYQYTFRADQLSELSQWAGIMNERMAALPGVMDVNSDQEGGASEARVVFDRGTAARLGITSQLVDDTLYDAFGQRLASTIYAPSNQYHVVLNVAPGYWRDPTALERLYVHSAMGAEVPLTAVTRRIPAQAGLAVNHQSQFPSVTLSFNLAPGTSLGTAVQSIEGAARKAGLPAHIIGTFQGTAQAFQDSLRDEPLLIAAALVAVYLVLGILYESLIHPITILSTLPSASVGALIALNMTGTPLDILGLIGMILLIGIVKKNAIMLIDFALEAERRLAKGPAAAIYEACLLRFRPILMTTMAALLGALPLLLQHNTGSELRRPLGVTIAGGLIASQLLTLYTTPVIYLYFNRLRLWWRGADDAA
jgi:multidrug efflux pump